MKFHYKKVVWSARALLYSFFFKKFSLPSYIGKPLFISGWRKIQVGRRVRIFPNLRAEALNDGKITINDNVYIGQNCHITSSGSELIIDEGSSIMANVCITNIDHDYERCDLSVLDQEITTRQTYLGKNCFIGHNATIQAGAQLGNHVIVGANSVVSRGKYPKNCVIVGAPARIVKIYDDVLREWVKY